MDGINKSMYDSFFFKSSKQCAIILSSDTTPNARIKINKGTGFRTFGTVTTNCSILYFIVFTAAGPATIFTAVVRTGLDASSDTERISAE